IYLPTRLLTQIGGNALTAILVMMLLAFILSLCSEADAFIGASLLSTFGTAPILAFLLIGPVVDIKNLMMMLHSFSASFIIQCISVSAAIVIVYCLVVGVIACFVLSFLWGILNCPCTSNSQENWTNTSILTTLIWPIFPWCVPLF